jgi:hypothetical protein
MTSHDLRYSAHILLVAALLLSGCGSPKTWEGESGTKLVLDSSWKSQEGLRPGDQVWKNGDATLTLRPWETRPGATLARAVTNINPSGDYLRQRLISMLEWSDQKTLIDEVLYDIDTTMDQDYDHDRALAFQERLASRLKQWESRPEMQAEMLAFAMEKMEDYQQIKVGPREMLMHNESHRPRAFFNHRGVVHVIELEGWPADRSEDTFLALIQGLSFDEPAANPPGSKGQP